MSNYVDTLRRLHADLDQTRSPVPAPPTIPAPTPVPPPSAVAAPCAEPVAERVAAAMARTMEAVRTRRWHGRHTDYDGVATLFDRLRSLPARGPLPTVVLTDMETGDAAGRVAMRCAEHARAEGLVAFVATVQGTNGRTVLQVHGDGVLPVGGDGTLPPYPTAVPALPIDTAGRLAHTELAAWLVTHGNGAGLALVIGPSLARSSVAALIACACDGLVLVARAGVTERAALERAIQRVRRLACPVVGTVCIDAEPMPAWLRRLTARHEPRRAVRTGATA